ncbi:non-ribosomal peptide synthetase [Pseudomonas azotoformans]|uniref:Non-ribosomal peptide synthetase n=1 Tax=Pseudomonas azotoformans TaxID=47878 RepID=A0A1V2JJT3_PSEAZ|nr:non-ribosomal peptide synthetase [Pseudomonas azotoformans]OIN46445.1 non-ribosomal peptide synthetase [Pseudomonas azotoformans]ONH44901.1 non-ribosomal peptide synthetase [Pseudomonas azotoformans]SDN10338.1 pyochelin synthetase [Pseudomonas azotoformans]
MPAATLLNELKSLGVELWPQDGQLKFRAPQGLLNAERLAQLREHKQQILQLLERQEHPLVEADPAQYHAPFPLTDVQNAYLLGRQSSFGYGNVACHGYLELSWPSLDPQRVEQAWNQLIARHPMLRAVIASEGSQRVLADVGHYPVAVTDLRGATREQHQQAVQQIRQAMEQKLYPTDVWPLFELRLSHSDNGDTLHFSMDSLLADWASAQLLFNELEQLLHDPQAVLPALDISFRDYLLAERGLLEGSRHQRDRDYWLARIDELPAAPRLPTPLSGEDISVPRFQRQSAHLDPTHWAALKSAASERGLTPTLVVLAAYVGTLQRWSQQPAFSLNLTLLNRLPLHPQVDRLVGDFTSVSLLHVKDPQGQDFTHQARQLGGQLFADLEHRLFSGIQVMREIGRRRGREAAAMPVVFTSAIGLGVEPPAGSQRQVGHGITQTPQVTLDCQVMDDRHGLHIHWDVRQGVFPEGLIEDMQQALLAQLQLLANDPAAWDHPIDVPLPAWQQRERLAANATAAPLPTGRLHDGLLAMAWEHPNAVAVIDAHGSLTYAELVARALAVASTLRDAGCAAQEPVAILIPKGLDQVVAAYGALLAGAAYLPLDSSAPAARRDRILQGAGVRHVLGQSRALPDTPLPHAVQFHAVDQLPPAAPGFETVDASADDLAYVIYTSGSTGEPKGVMISHRAALNTVQDINRRFQVNAGDRVLGLAQLSFDLSVYDLFGPLAVGGTLVLPDPARGADPSHWAEQVQRHQVTLWNSVPAQLHMLAHYLQAEPRPLDSLRLALLSGDWIPLNLPPQLHALLPGLKLVGLGGATEASIWSNLHPIGTIDPAWRSIPYGLPLANQGFRVLDGQWRDAPTWVPGELYITGVGLAQGYLGDQALSEARFFAHPLDGQRLYRTGDRGRYLPGGELEFLGREDGQVKVRGHRVELGEIDAALLATPGVDGAASLLNGELLAFVTPARAEPAPLPGAPLLNAVNRYAENQVGSFEAQQVHAYQADLNAAALSSMLDVMLKAGLFRAEQVEPDVEHILRALQAEPRHHWLVRRWLEALCAAGLLRLEHTRYRLPHTAPEPALAWGRVEQAVTSGLCSQALLDYQLDHVRQLPQLLRGEVNPFDLLFPQGRQERALQLYGGDAVSRYNNHSIAALINRLATHHEGDGPLRILEIGAGTGATSASVISLLDGLDVDYLFTDMTAFFLPAAKQRFADQPWVRYGVLDIDQDYRPQGLASNSVDIVLCAGMLNSVKDIDTSLSHITELLRPGGWLVFSEPTGEWPPILLTQGFMMTPVNGDHEHGRSGLRNAEIWQARIQAFGGECLPALPHADHPLVALGMQVFAARFKAGVHRLSVDSLRRALAQRLPDYMLPAHLQVLDRMPLTANGKVDRRTLAAWRPAVDAQAPAGQDAPSNPLTAQLCRLWAEALGLAQIGVDDSFYEKGADSLILARVAGQLREQLPQAQGLSYDTLLRQMLNEPNIAALARLLKHGESTPSAAAISAEAQRSSSSNALVVPFGGGEVGPVRVMFHAALGTLDYFQHLGRALAEQQAGPVLGFAVADTEQYLALEPKRLIESVAQDYAERLIADGHQRFQLIGYCLGGLLATEVARRLLERGMEVVDLSLIDSIPMFIDTDEELAYEAIFVPNLNLDPVKTVFGAHIEDYDVYRAIDLLMARDNRRVPAGAMAALSGDPGLDALALAVQKQSARSQAERLAEYARLASGQAGVPIGPELVPTLFRVCRHSMRAARFDPPPFLGNMTYLRCLEQQSFGITGGVGHLAAPFWEDACLGRFDLIDVPGNHFSVIEPPHVHLVTAHLLEALRKNS